MRLYIAGILLATSSIASASAPNEGTKDSYLTALAAMDHETALYSLLLDEVLAARCGRQASVEDLKGHAETLLPVLAALKYGQVDEARRLVKAIPCPADEAHP